jgi:probable addiction module antidote protein
MNYNIPQVLKTAAFDKWFRRMRDVRAKVRIDERIERLAAGHPGDAKMVGGGVLKFRKYDVADYLDGDEMVAAYLDLAFESGDLSRIAAALGNVARARGMTKIANATGLSREQLYKTLSVEGRPELATVLKVMAAFGGGLRSDFSKPKQRKLTSRARQRKAAA